jgi:glutamine cyclotransferase
MKVKPILPILLMMLTAGCAGRKANSSAVVSSSVTEPIRYSYVVRASYPHATTSYTQGLYFEQDCLWEGTGQYGASVLQRVDLESGDAKVLATLPHTEFGEGIARLHDRIYQLTWQNNVAHVYDAQSFAKVGDIPFSGEGWGLTTDGEHLYLSDGSTHIYEVDPTDFRHKRTITVTASGRVVPYLNELEWIEGKIWANVYTTDLILIINPDTGVVEGIVDLSGLLPESEVTPTTDVLNGIAYDVATKRVFVTGKNWSRLFEIELVKQ